MHCCSAYFSADTYILSFLFVDTSNANYCYDAYNRYFPNSFRVKNMLITNNVGLLEHLFRVYFGKYGGLRVIFVHVNNFRTYLMVPQKSSTS